MTSIIDTSTKDKRVSKSFKLTKDSIDILDTIKSIYGGTYYNVIEYLIDREAEALGIRNNHVLLSSSETKEPLLPSITVNYDLAIHIRKAIGASAKSILSTKYIREIYKIVIECTDDEIIYLSDKCKCLEVRDNYIEMELPQDIIGILPHIRVFKESGGKILQSIDKSELFKLI